MARPSISAAAAILGAIVLLVLVAARFGTRPAQPLGLSLPWSVEEFHTKNARRLAEAVGEATDGRVEIVLYPGATLGIKGPDSLRAASDGVVAMIDMAAFQQVGQEPILGLDALPFLVRDQRELRLLYEELRPAIEEALADHGLKLLTVVPWPPQNLYTQERIERPEDLDGLVVRTLDANTTELAERLGMAPVQLASPDVVPSLAAGSLDAVMTSTTTGAAQKYWQFLNFIHRTNHGWVTNLLVVNAEIWRDIAPEDRAAIERVAAELEPEFWAVSREDDRDKLTLLTENGMEAVPVEGDLRAWMQESARPMWRAFARRVDGTRAIINRFLERTGRAPLSKETDEEAQS